MTEKQIKEELAKSSAIWKDADRSIRDMKIKLGKYNGDKTEQTKHVLNLDNLLNLSHRQAMDINTYEDLLAKYMFKIGELSAKVRKLELQIKIDKQIAEM
tara:strand:+ start:1423 stop:1722 length:300 start_codon:yes stop_codon:yes gene_type:complete